MTDVRSMTILAALLVVVGFECQAAGGACPTAADRPDVTQPPPPPGLRTLEPYSINQTVSQYYDAPLGLGFLEVIEEKKQHYYDWMFEVEFPLWYSADAVRPLGWLLDGQIHSDTEVEKLTGAGMVETAYEHTSFIVWKTDADWLELRLTGDLYAWTHRCHLETAGFRLELVDWETFFGQHADWLHFRKPVPHTLRGAPSAESQRVTTIGLDHKLVLLDIRGDWMEVEVHQPDLTCAPSDPDEAQAIQHRGWVKWRDEQGPWVYVYTRGC